MNNTGLSPKEYLLEILKDEESVFREVTRLDEKRESSMKGFLIILKKYIKRKIVNCSIPLKKAKLLKT